MLQKLLMWLTEWWCGNFQSIWTWHVIIFNFHLILKTEWINCKIEIRVPNSHSLFSLSLRSQIPVLFFLHSPSVTLFPPIVSLRHPLLRSPDKHHPPSGEKILLTRSASFLRFNNGEREREWERWHSGGVASGGGTTTRRLRKKSKDGTFNILTSYNSHWSMKMRVKNKYESHTRLVFVVLKERFLI